MDIGVPWPWRWEMNAFDLYRRVPWTKWFDLVLYFPIAQYIRIQSSSDNS